MKLTLVSVTAIPCKHDFKHQSVTKVNQLMRFQTHFTCFALYLAIWMSWKCTLIRVSMTSSGVIEDSWWWCVREWACARCESKRSLCLLEGRGLLCWGETEFVLFLVIGFSICAKLGVITQYSQMAWPQITFILDTANVNPCTKQTRSPLVTLTLLRTKPDWFTVGLRVRWQSCMEKL